jgi:hypothetical protein
MEIPNGIHNCDIRYTSDTAIVTFFFVNHARVAVTFTLNKDAQCIEFAKWTGIEPCGARVWVPEHDQKVVIRNLKIIDVPGNPLLFSGYIDVSRRGASDSVECWRSHIAMNIELPCSSPNKSADDDEVLYLD